MLGIFLTTSKPLELLPHRVTHIQVEGSVPTLAQDIVKVFKDPQLKYKMTQPFQIRPPRSWVNTRLNAFDLWTAKGSAYTEVVAYVDSQLIKYIWLASPDCLVILFIFMGALRTHLVFFCIFG